MSSDFPQVRKPRVDPRSNIAYQPSRVLFIRGLPHDLPEQDIIDFCGNVGVVESVFYLKGKGQAFVEFDSDEAADECLRFFHSHPPRIRDQKLHFSYSGRTQIERKPPEEPKPNRVLLLSVSNVKHPMTPDTVQKIFERYGSVLRCVLFERSFGFQSFVELESLSAAMNAKMEIDGVNIFPDSNLLRVQYSLLKHLKIEYPSALAKDFQQGNVSQLAEQMLQKVQKVNLKKTEEIVVLFLHNLSTLADPDLLFNLFSLYGNVVRIKIFQSKRDMALIEYNAPDEAEAAQKFLNNLPFLGKTLLVSFSRNNYMHMPDREEKRRYCKEYINSPFQRYTRPGSKNYNHVVAPSAVLHLSNLPEKVEESYFADLFREQGPVVAYKSLHSDRRMALVKFATLEVAIAVLVYHHNRVLFGRHLKIAFSKSAL